MTSQEEADILLAEHQAMKRSGAAQGSPQMSEMVERVARVLAEREGSGPWECGLLGDRGRDMWRATVRAAIEAMREPTEAMVKAAQPIARDNYPDDLWRAMIDKALEKSK